MFPEPTELLLIGCLIESIWTPKSKSNTLTPKNQLADILTKGSLSKNEWNHLTVIGAMSKRGKEATSNDGSPTAKAKPVNLVMRSQYKGETSSSSLGSRVNLENDDERKRIGQAPGNWEQGNSKSEVENSQVSRQEKILQATRKLRQKDQTQIKSGENPPGTRKLAACSPEFRNMDCTNYRHLEKFFPNLEVANVCTQCNIFNGLLQEHRVGMENVHDIVDDGSHPRWSGFLDEFRNLQEHNIREYLECIQHYSKVDEGTFSRNSECGMLGIFITIMDEISIGQ